MSLKYNSSLKLVRVDPFLYVDLEDKENQNTTIDWRKALRDQAKLTYGEVTSKSTEKSIKRLNHDPLPPKQLQSKVDYFYLHHNYKQNLDTYMPEMDSKSTNKGWDTLYKFVTDNKSDSARRKRVYTKLDKIGGYEKT